MMMIAHDLARHLDPVLFARDCGIEPDPWQADFLRSTRNSRVPVFVYEAKRKIGMFCMSCRSAMNFVRESLFAGPMRNSGSVWRSAFATTNSDGGMSGRMVRSQDP